MLGRGVPGLALVLAMCLSACGSGGSTSGEAATKETNAGASAQPTSGSSKKGLSASVCAEKTFGQKCKFGQSAAFTASAGSEPKKAIRIVVTKPKVFTPAAGDAITGATQAVNIFVLIKLTNLSDTVSWADPAVLSYAKSAGRKGSQIYTDDYCCGGKQRGQLIPKQVPPGTSITYRDEWSVADADDVTYELDLEGLAGHKITFSR